MSKRTNKGNLKNLKDKHDKKVSEIEDLEKEIVNQVFDNYINEEDQKQLIEDAKTFHYSETKISSIQKVFDNFNTDTIEYNIAVDIIDMQEHIQQYKKEGFFSKIANVVMPEDK